MDAEYTINGGLGVYMRGFSPSDCRALLRVEFGDRRVGYPP